LLVLTRMMNVSYIYGCERYYDYMKNVPLIHKI
jgi:hypothetical protein